MSSLSAVRGEFERRFQGWLNRRVPRVREARLSQRNVFIFPTVGGLVFLVLLLSLLLAGINYENNLVLALTFLLGSMFVVSILHTYANLAGLAVSALQADAVFAGQEACFRIKLRDEGQRCHDGLLLEWESAEPVLTRVAPGDESSVSLFLQTRQRGLMRPERLRMESRYPTGLIRAWCRLALDAHCIVYPTPGPLAQLARSAGEGDDGLLTEDAGGDDFSGFREYRPGDPIRHVAWKTLARGQPLQLREYIRQSDRQRWLDWNDTELLGHIEYRLSVLCRWVLELDHEGCEFGLAMPNQRIGPSRGDVHREQCLTALALYGIDREAE